MCSKIKFYERVGKPALFSCPKGGGHLYPVSDAFLSAVKGSGYITNQCCGSTEIELGTVYAAEMRISFFCDIDRYTLKDAAVTLAYHLQLEDGSYEEVPVQKN